MEMVEVAEQKDGTERNGWNGDDGKLRSARGEQEGRGLGWVEQRVSDDYSGFSRLPLRMQSGQVVCRRVGGTLVLGCRLDWGQHSEDAHAGRAGPGQGGRAHWKDFTG